MFTCTKTQQVLNQDPDISRVNKGSIGRKYRVKHENSGATFFVKSSVEIDKTISSKVMMSKIIDKFSEEEKTNFIKDIFEKEFLILSLLNLLGFKTPSEMALLQHEGGSILITREVGDMEDRGEKPTTHDTDYQNRLDLILKTLAVGDVEGENIIPVYDRAGKENRKIKPAAIDPTLMPADIEDDYLSFNTKIKNLSKIAYYYDANKPEIDNLLEKLDDQFRKFGSQLYKYILDNLDEFYQDYPPNKGEEYRNNLKKRVIELQTDVPKSNEKFLLSSRLKKVVNKIKDECEEHQYLPNPNGIYLSRKKPHFLDSQVIFEVLDKVNNFSSQEGTQIFPNILNTNVKTCYAQLPSKSPSLNEFKYDFTFIGNAPVIERGKEESGQESHYEQLIDISVNDNVNAAEIVVGRNRRSGCVIS